MPDSPPLVLRGVGHHFGDKPVLKAVDLQVAAGELVALLGASGCGKTTLLRAVAGLELPARGSIHIGAEVVCEAGRERVPTERRRVGLVFQDHALFPALSVADNVGFGLRPAEPQRVQELLTAVGLGGLGARRPATLSGGQRQRVSFARALAPRPQVLLLDEPFASVDAALKDQLAAELLRAVKRQGAPTLLVTHDRQVALAVADRVAVLVPGAQGGVLAQIGTPQQVYARPVSAQVAALTGECQVLEAQALGAVADTALGQVALAEPAQGPVTLLLRPEQLEFSPGPGPHTLSGCRFRGPGWNLELSLGEGPLRCLSPQPHAAGTQGTLTARGPLWAFPSDAA